MVLTAELFKRSLAVVHTTGQLTDVRLTHPKLPFSTVYVTDAPIFLTVSFKRGFTLLQVFVSFG